MNFVPGNLYHVYNQGNNHQLLFCDRRDYLTFLSLYRRLIHPYVNTIAWTLMPNHFHFMFHTDDQCLEIKQQGNLLMNIISNGFRKLLSGYARIYNRRTGRTGSAFRQKTKSKCLTDIRVKENEDVRDYFVNCFHYVHQNPLTAGLVKRMEDWEYSSFKDYAGLRQGDLCRKDLAMLYCDYREEDFMTRSYQLVEQKISKQFE
jgi:putative transposase